ncbi:TatD family hydrolase [Flavobacterium caeni]|uniref:TatD DNase family protein n=1 Tax=Flavobacterium caeni TaxID=490189 RepID=A0A1G5BLW6_9FLAO|nr:TatD DNase family protein [Flavobacterium caeni]
MYVNLHTHRFTDDPNILEVVNQYPREFDATIPQYSMGIHPWYIDESWIEADLQIIEGKLQTNNCLAVGECGLDKRIEVPMELQQSVFDKQLALAEKYKKPVVIHCVAAFQELVETKKKMNISVPMIVHGFSKNEQVARQLLDNGFYLSFGKYLLRNPELEGVFKMVPDDRLFLETDTVEESIVEVCELAAKYKQTSVEALKELIHLNFRQVFQKEVR